MTQIPRISEPQSPGIASQTSAPPELEVRGLHKRYGKTPVLKGVSIRVSRGEVVGLIGENGAGKSTLFNIMSGAVQPDAGELLIKGEQTTLRNARDANRHGVFHIHQELALVPNLPVYENLFLSHEDRFIAHGLINRGRMLERAREFLAKIHPDRVDPAAITGLYDFSTRQVIEICKALALADLLDVETPIILLDEPTAGLTHDEVDFFKELVVKIKPTAAIIFVAHRLSEVLELSDRIYVLRDGELTAEVSPEVSENELHKHLVGRERPELYYHEQEQLETSGDAVIEARRLGHAGAFHDIDMSVHAGEIVGIAGLVGCGKEQLARAIFGTVTDLSGELVLGGRLITHPSIDAAMRSDIGYVSPDRRHEGVMLDLPVSWNMSIAALNRPSEKWRLINPRREEARARELISGVGIKTAGPRATVRTLSGGNQQKLLIARWLYRGNNRGLILHNPTQGVDAGAKEEIYRLIRRLAADGCGILLVSDDLLEVIGLSNRVLVMKDGAITMRVEAPVDNKPTEADLVAHMI